MYIKLLLERLFKDLFFKKCKCNIFSGNSVHKILNLKYKGFPLVCKLKSVVLLS